MKKLLFISLALVLALGALGVSYASWTDKVTITGTVKTGNLCFSIDQGTIGEVSNCYGTPIYTFPGATPGPGDTNWTTFVPGAPDLSCPPGFVFPETAWSARTRMLPG